jgi:phospholipid/cholesterol/gamma-HCH transport system substrate-binding protein
MIQRSVYYQLVAFAVISIVGILYVGSAYVGLFELHGPYTVRAYFPSSGGIFTNANVTERGVSVGKVSNLKLAGYGGACRQQSGCIEVDLAIDHGNKIPAQGIHATIADLSAVGEQYVDLEPAKPTGPMLHAGSSIVSTATTLPVDNAAVLQNLDNLLTSVNDPQLATVINELGKGFTNLGPALQRLIDNGDALTKSAIAALPQTLTLVDDGKTVLDTQRAVASELKSFAASFAQFSGQLATSDPSLRGVFDNGVGASKQLSTLLADNSEVLPTLLSNLITFNGIQAVRLPQVRTVLEIYPADTAAGFHTTPGDGTAHFGSVSDSSSPCTTGYSSTTLRSNNPSDWGGPGNLDAYCHGAGATGTYRGSRNIPRPAGDNANITNASPYPGAKYHGGKSSSSSAASPSSSSSSVSPSSSSSAAAPSGTSGDTVVPVPYNPTTGLLTGLDGKSYQLGANGPTAPIFGSSSWEWLLLAPTMK